MAPDTPESTNSKEQVWSAVGLSQETQICVAPKKFNIIHGKAIYVIDQPVVAVRTIYRIIYSLI